MKKSIVLALVALTFTLTSCYSTKAGYAHKRSPRRSAVDNWCDINNMGNWKGEAKHPLFGN